MLDFQGFLWRRERDSNPCVRVPKRFSRPPRYDHFDIPPYMKLLSQKSSDYSIFLEIFLEMLFSVAFGVPEKAVLTRVFAPVGYGRLAVHRCALRQRGIPRVPWYFTTRPWKSQEQSDYYHKFVLTAWMRGQKSTGMAIRVCDVFFKICYSKIILLLNIVLTKQNNRATMRVLYD